MSMMPPPADPPNHRPGPRALLDASSAILLAKAELIAPCCAAFTLIMTRSVFDEATVAARPDAAGLRALADRRPGFAVIAAPRRYGAMIGADIGRLHRGERDTLHHYLCGAARFIIIDDRKALQVCRRYGIPHVNALLCPKLLHFGGFMPEGHRVDACMDRLAGLGRYSAPVIQWARSCRRTDLAFFIGGRGQ